MIFKTKLINVILVALIIAFEPSYAAIESCSRDRFRLPERIRPKHYELKLRPQFETSEQFTGSVDITFEVIGTGNDGQDRDVADNQFVLNVNPDYVYLKEDQIRFYSDLSSSSQLELTELCLDEENELLWVSLSKQLPVGFKGIAHFEFDGNYRQDSQGLYQSKTISEKNHETLRYISTQLESTYARSIFPCFDEPKFRSTIRLTLTHPEGTTALANTDPESSASLRDEPGNMQQVVFKTTPEMPVYLFAFAIAKMEFIERRVFGGKLRVRVYAQPGAAEQGRVALDIACDAVELMQKELGIAYPAGSKVDFVPIPEFKAGAMENLGLIFYSPDLVLANQQNAQLALKLEMVVTILHELVHQWIGNMVSLNWWTDLWLKEGFATWLSYYYGHKLYPTLGLEPDRFLVQAHEVIMATNLMPDSPPVIRKNLRNSDEIEESFDVVSYDKGAMILRWLQYNLGPDMFKLGLQEFLSHNANGNVTTDQFIGAMQEFTALPLDKFLNSYLYQPNYPLLFADYDPNTNQLMIEQRPINEDEDEGKLWFVASDVLVANSKEQLRIAFTMENERKISVQLPAWFGHCQFNDVGCDAWLKLNPESVGIYRVRYSTALLDRLRLALSGGKLSVADRLNLIDDMFALEKSSLYSQDELIKTWSLFKGETNLLVIEALVKRVAIELKRGGEKSLRHVDLLVMIGDICNDYFTQFGYHSDELTLKRIRNNFDIYKRARIAPEAATLNEISSINRILSSLINLRHEPTIKHMIGQLESRNGLEAVHLREPICLAVLKSGDQDKMKRLLELASQNLSTLDERRSLADFLANQLELPAQSELFAMIKIWYAGERQKKLDAQSGVMSKVKNFIDKRKNGA